VKKERQAWVKLEIFPGTQLHKMESLKPIRGIYEINQKLEYRNELDRNDTVLVTIHHFLFQFSLKWQFRKVNLPVHLMPHLFTKFEQTCTKIITWHFYTIPCKLLRLNDTIQAWRRSKVTNSGSLDLLSLSSAISVSSFSFTPASR
jgi:hypothetical protein